VASTRPRFITPPPLLDSVRAILPRAFERSMPHAAVQVTERYPGTGPGADLGLVALVRRQRITRPGGSRITLSPTASAAKRELHRICTPKATARWLIHMTGGGAKRRPNHAYHSPSTTNAKGCWIAAAGSALDSGYRVAAPFIPRRHGPPASLRPHPIHRLAMRAWGSWELQRAMLEQGHHVSHLCHNRACYNPSHLTVEDSDANIARHACAAGFVACRCTPRCIV
jgi:hypothetical protein